MGIEIQGNRKKEIGALRRRIYQTLVHSYKNLYSMIL